MTEGGEMKKLKGRKELPKKRMPKADAYKLLAAAVETGLRGGLYNDFDPPITGDIDNLTDLLASRIMIEVCEVFNF